MVICTLKDNIDKVINGNISLDQFAKWFEDWFQDELSNIEKETKYYDSIEKLYQSIGLYEPVEALREDDPSYFGDEELINKLNILLKEISD